MCVCVCVCVCVSCIIYNACICCYSDKHITCMLIDSHRSWAEVMLSDKKWYSLHVPTMSVKQPSLCEKHAPFKLTYVVAFEGLGNHGNRQLCVCLL